MKTETDDIRTDTNISSTNPEELFDLKDSQFNQKSQSVQKDAKCFDHALCMNGNQCLLVCGTQNCLKRAVVCGDKKCKCRSDHESNGAKKKLCGWFDPEKIMQLIEKKRVSNSELIQEVHNRFESLIDEISNFHDRTIQRMQNLGLDQLEVEFLNHCYRHEFDDLNGKMVWQVMGKLDQQNKSTRLSSVDFSHFDQTIRSEFEQIIRPSQKKFGNLIENIMKEQLPNKIEENDRLELNEKNPALGKISRTIIMIDATKSMEDAFKMVEQVIETSLPRVRIIQSEQSNADVKCELQLCVYRNYNSTEDMILQHSNFQSQSQPLIQWFKNIQVEGEWGNEAIEVGLQYVNSLKDVDQVIIIGDAVANTKRETDYKRSYKSYKNVWDASTRYPKTYFSDELEKIKSKSIKIHSFYLNPSSTKHFFQNMSKNTGGKSEEFEIRSENATDQFIGFVSERILENLAQKANRKDLLELYSKTFSS